MFSSTFFISLILSGAAQVVQPTIFSNTSIPSTANYAHTIQLASTSSGEFNLSWTLQGQDIKFLISISGPTMNFGWVSIGFGPDMRKSEMIVVHQVPNGSLIHVHKATGNEYGSPPLIPNQSLVTQISGGYIQGVLFAEFIRPISPSNKFFRSLETNQNVIWAYNPKSNKNFRGEWFSYHGVNTGSVQTHGAVALMLNSGSNSKVVIGSLQNKLIHGFGMSIVYLILIPIAIYWARYLKSYQYWFVTHATMQIFNYVSIIVFFIVILLEYQEFNIDHAILGLLVLSLTTVQVFFGGFTRLGMIKDDVNTFRILKYCHQVTGLTVVLLSIIQVGLGLYILYPLYDGRGIEFWIIYGVIVCFWIIVFVSTEVYYHKKVYYSKSDKLLAKPITNKQNKIEKVERVPLDRIKHLEKNQNTEIESLKTFTWDEIDENVRDGKILVVANGNYVYDASVWIKSHPGGKLILYSVAGTDISLDFFYSAGFDAQSFVVQKPVSSKSRHSALSQSSTIFNGSIPLNNSFPNQKPEYRRQVQLTDQECNVLTKSRRTNVHSRLALERLSSLMVGQLSATKRIESQASPSEDNNFTFSCSEYRRFALVSKTLKSESINHIVWNMKFTLLYPFDVRESQPVEFSPGEMIEMQIRTLNGEIINKLFYPMNGDLSCFEILVTVSNDPFDQYLNSQRIGDKQFKIRGPMLKPFIPSVIGVPKSSLLPENLIFIRLLYLI